MIQQRLAIWSLVCNKRWILYDNQRQPAQWLDWKEASKHFPKPNLNQKKVMVTVWWSAASLIHYSFLNSSATITSEKYAQQIKETHWKLQHLQPTLVTREGPVLFHDNVRPHVTQPISASGYEVLPHPLYLPDLSPIGYLFKHRNNCLQGKCFHKQQKQKMVSRRSLNSTAWIFFLLGLNTYSFLAKNVLIVMVPTLINRDEFEPSYNDLKFRVQNHCYFCTNLIVKAKRI